MATGENDEDKEATRSTITNEKDIPWAWIKATQHILEQKEESSSSTAKPEFPVQILPWLYLSDMDSVDNDVIVLKETGITHVLTTNKMPEYQLQNLSSQLKVVGIKHLAVPGLDNESYNMIGNHLEECRLFLQQAQKAVVHCAAGMNRSGLIVGAAMLVLEQMALLDVVRLLKTKRGTVLTNLSFQVQLCLLAAQCGRLGPKPEEFSDEWP